ncbi:2-hydroxy-6-oxonona-2,4-dienedioate hydrolase [Spinactinospora alkalitolerans]|uniref:2-hydroxy-6-oxonona-2,4-dienedioate hydrolase n=1 Tax=Spinactinospora alkalitolerans TaxID=687207 RepID=A0A852TV31_9ACTN|nr:alpha/beta fold hydrolase [Spinactinospora alkalitolerans]NYE47157.1 2-hydroxy-6-oxonona-2,4-dienedioate hydrolase [Spinactinospora alkalitolerans]
MSIWTELADTDFTVSHAPVRGGRTRVLRAGEEHDEHVVLLHGTSGHLEAFIRNVPALAERFAVHALDMLGHGYTDNHPGGDLRIPRYVRHVLDYLDSRGIERAHFIGESLGGWVAGRLAADHPDRVGRLVLVAPGGTVANPEVMNRIRTSTRAAVGADDRELTQRRLELLMHDSVNVSEELIDVRHAIYNRPRFVTGVDSLLCLQDMEKRTEDLLTAEQMARITAPTHIVWGAQNPFGDVPEAKRMQQSIPGSLLEIFPECGHWPQHEHADRFNKLALGFLGAA